MKWQDRFTALVLIIVALGAAGVCGVFLYSYGGIVPVLMFIVWLVLIILPFTDTPTLLILTVVGALTGVIFGTVFEVINWLVSRSPFNVRNIADLAFYFAISFPALFNLGFVKGKNRMP